MQLSKEKTRAFFTRLDEVVANGLDFVVVKMDDRIRLSIHLPYVNMIYVVFEKDNWTLYDYTLDGETMINFAFSKVPSVFEPLD